MVGCLFKKNEGVQLFSQFNIHGWEPKNDAKVCSNDYEYNEWPDAPSSHRFIMNINSKCLNYP